MTKKTISVWAKKSFIYWFIENYQFSNENPIAILKEIAQTEKLLSRLKIVMNGSYLRPLLVISTEGTGMPPLLYKTMDNAQTDLRLVLEHLYSMPESPIYLTLYFPERSCSEPYQAVVEEPVDYNSMQNDQLLIDFELSLWSAGLKREQEREEIMKEIDQSLVQGNKRKFRRLVKKLKQL